VPCRRPVVALGQQRRVFALARVVRLECRHLWAGFQPFECAPLEIERAGVDFVDVTGDGAPDLLVAVMASYTPEEEDADEFKQRMRFVIDDRALNMADFLNQLAPIAKARTPDASPLVAEYLRRLAKTLFLLSQFALDRDEAGVLIEHHNSFELRRAGLLNPTQEELTRLHLFVQLKEAMGDAGGGLVKAMQAGPDGADALAGLAGWSPVAVRRLADGLGIDGPVNDLLALARLQCGFRLVEALGADVEYLIDLVCTNDLSFGFYQRHAATLFGLLRARYDEEQWPRVYKPIHDILALQKRDSLTGGGAAAAGRRDPGRACE